MGESSFGRLRFAAIFVCAFFCLVAQSQAQSDETAAGPAAGTVTGIVIDSLLGEPVAFASVRVEGTRRGAVTREDGRFLLRLPAGRYTLNFSHVSFSAQQRSVEVVAGDTLRVNVGLAPAGVVIPEVVVALEDPGVAMMRRAIARKMTQVDSLENYRYTLYTKFVAKADTNTAGRISIAGRDTVVIAIFESFSDGYFQRPDNYYNEIYQRRQSANVPPQANFVAFGTNLNAYDDVISILGEEIATPFHPDALDYYDFVFERTLRGDGGRELNRIRATPRSEGRRLFDGVIFLDAEGFYPTRVDLEPNVAVRLPFDAELTYQQLFEELDGFVAPTGMRINAHVNATFLWIFDPRLDVLIETVASDYTFNFDIDEDLFGRRRVEAADEVDNFDSTYWFDHAVVALTPEEERAYAEILTSIENPDSIEARSYFDRFAREINTVVRTLNGKPFTGMQDVFAYNSINGARLGLGMSDFVLNNLEASGKIAYGTADGRAMGELGLNVFLDDLHRVGLKGSLHRDLLRRDSPYFVTSRAITPVSLIFGADYGDYYYSEGFQAGLAFGLGQEEFIRRDVFVKPHTLDLFVRQERQQNAPTGSSFSFLGGSERDRENPPIFGGMMRTLNAELNLDYSPLRRISDLGLRLTAEISDPALLASDFSFERYEGTLFWRTRTLPLWRLDLRLSGGLTRGELPPQRFFSAETSVSGTAVDGSFRTMDVKEFYGDKYFSINAEHNFGEVIPGLLRIPNVAAFGIEFIGVANFHWSEFDDKTRTYSGTTLPSIADTRRQVFYELGLGINRVLIFLRTDITARMTQADSPRFSITVSRATF